MTRNDILYWIIIVVLAVVMVVLDEWNSRNRY